MNRRGKAAPCRLFKRRFEAVRARRSDRVAHACEKERSAVRDAGVHGRYPARAAVAGSTLDGGQCGGRCRAPIHLASGV